MMGKLITNVIWVTVVFIIQQTNVFCAGDCPLPYSDKLEHKDLLTKFVSGSATGGSKAKLSCATRHYLDGPNTIECTNDKWVANSDDTYLRCALIKCGNPHKIKIENGKINTFVLPGLNRSSGDYLQDSVYWSSCDEGFILKGNPVRRCMWNGTHGIWSQPADIYGENPSKDGDSPPVCEEDILGSRILKEGVDSHIVGVKDPNSEDEKNFIIMMAVIIVIYLIGSIGTGCAVCMFDLKSYSINRLIIEMRPRNEPCNWNFKRFWQGLLFAIFFFLVPIALLCEVCKRKLKTVQNDGQGQIQPLAEENSELAAQTRQRLIAQIHQLTAQNQHLTEQNQQITEEKRELTTQNQQNNQDIANLSKKIHELIVQTDELSGKVEPFVTADEAQQDVGESNQNTQGGPCQTLLTQIDKLKFKHRLLSNYIEQLIQKNRLTKRLLNI